MHTEKSTNGPENEKAAEPDRSTAEINRILALSVSGLLLHFYSRIYAIISQWDREFAQYQLHVILLREDSKAKRVFLASFAQGAQKQRMNHHGAERRRWAALRNIAVNAVNSANRES